MSPDIAETIALRALQWLAAEEEICGAFLGASGAAAEDLYDQAQDPAFLAAVLAFITSQDTWIIAFCDAAGLDYDAPLRAHYALPGAEMVHWT